MTIKSVQRTAEFTDGYYCVGLPLKDKGVKMANNRCVAEQRAAGLKRKLMKNKEFFEDCRSFMDSILENSYSMEVAQDQLSRDDHRVWYVPHHRTAKVNAFLRKLELSAEISLLRKAANCTGLIPCCKMAS